MTNLKKQKGDQKPRQITAKGEKTEEEELSRHEDTTLNLRSSTLAQKLEKKDMRLNWGLQSLPNGQNQVSDKVQASVTI